MEIVSSIDRTQNFKHKQLDLHGLFKVLNFSQFPKNMVITNNKIIFLKNKRKN